jgi:hypothetical protein
MVHSSGKAYRSAQRRLLNMQNVWVMYLRHHGEILKSTAVDVSTIIESFKPQSFLIK